MKAVYQRIAIAIITASTLIGVAEMSSAEADQPRAFERVARIAAPRGYVAYIVRLWKTTVSGQLASVTVSEDGMLKFTVDGEHQLDVQRVAADVVAESIVYVRESFRPSAELLALSVRRPADSASGPSDVDSFTLRFIGMDPDDPTARIYEARAKQVVYYGTVLGFRLDEASARAGYPYRGPFWFSGPVKFRLPRYAGEKSVFKIPTSVEIPDVLIEK